jgi:arylsulfatase
VPAGKVENGIISGLDWFPTFLAAAGNPNIADELKKGKELNGATYKVHVDDYNQLDMIFGKGPSNRQKSGISVRANLVLSASMTLSSDSSISLAVGWVRKPNQTCRISRTFASIRSKRRVGRKSHQRGSLQYFDWFKYQFWRFVFVQQEVEELAMTASSSRRCKKGQASISIL